MGFNEARRETVQALRDGRFQHEERAQAGGKNLLASGEVSVDDVVALLLRCRGNQHQTGLHHFDRTQVVHIFRPVDGPDRWYIKSYLVEQDGITAVFISVHR
jgi:hypothetical protein